MKCVHLVVKMPKFPVKPGWSARWTNTSRPRRWGLRRTRQFQRRVALARGRRSRRGRMFGRFGGGGNFVAQYRCYPVSFIDRVRLPLQSAEPFQTRARRPRSVRLPQCRRAARAAGAGGGPARMARCGRAGALPNAGGWRRAQARHRATPAARRALRALHQREGELVGADGHPRAVRTARLRGAAALKRL